MKKWLPAKKWLAWALVAAMLFGESGVVTAAEAGSAQDSYLIETELSSESEAAEEAVLEPTGGDSEEVSEAEAEEMTSEAEESTEEAIPEAEESTEETVPEAEENTEETIPEVEENTEEMPSEAEEPVETIPEPEVTSSEILLTEDNIATVKACGSDGILYSGVTYLSAATVLGFDADTREAYRIMCDEIARDKQAGEGIRDAVFFTDKNGDLGGSYFVPNILVSGENEEKYSQEPGVGFGVTILRDTEIEGNSVTEIIEKARYSAENYSLSDSVAVTEQDIEAIQDDSVSFDTYYANEDFFKNQLSNDTEKKIYDAAKAKMVKGSSNSTPLTVPSTIGAANISNALSALQDAYPLSFEWADRTTETGGWSFKYRYKGGSLSGTLSMTKSKHYSSGLVSSAKKQAQKLTKEAYQYAETNYPNAPTYGIIKYFDDWICANNYYNYVGLGETSADMKSKEYYYCHSSIGILLKGYGVCESYALAMNRLLDEAGIPSMVVYGTGGGGGHAWNYVLMPDGKWYMLDSTWNDSSKDGVSSTGSYFLSAADSEHVADGKRFGSGKTFTYPALASSKYSASTNETITLNNTQLVLAKGKKAQLSVNTTYYSDYNYSWTSGDVKVAKVDAKGNVTAVGPGVTYILFKLAGKMIPCTVCVYQFDSLQFSNNKTSYTLEYGNPDTVFNASDLQTITLNVVQKGDSTMTAAAIQAANGLEAPTATSSNTKIATVSSCTLSGNTITLKVQPVAKGSAKVNVSFGGKKATLTLRVGDALQAGWFENLPITSTEYTGKAIKPKVTASASMPKGVKYKVTYANNVNAGTATVSISGTGSYAGTITKTFQITPRDFSVSEFVSCTKSKVYTGKENPAVTVVKWNGKKLKAGTDYTVTYNNSATAPVNTGTYTVKVVGTGNYKGSISTSFTYEIMKAPITKLKVTCPSSVKYNGTNVTPAVTVKIGSAVISSENYTLTWQNAEGKTVPLIEKGKYTLIVTPKGNVEPTAKKTEIRKTVTVK